MSFPRLRFAVLVTSSCAALAFACGGIADPTKGGNSEKVATVSGALTGTAVPANARVALVWRTATSSATEGGYAVGDDVPVVAGKFTMSLAIPAAAYFSNIDGKGNFDNDGSNDAPSGSSAGNTTDPSPPPPPLPSGGGKMPSFGSRLAPRDTVSGGITSPLSGAVAGFVVYVDTNGNGKLDLSGAYAASTDQILGGNKELVLMYLKDGGALDYEKLRDRSSILPAEGFNLAWTVGKRWMPLNVVELKLDPKQGLPSPVCSSSGYNAGGSSSGSAPLDPVATLVPMPEPAPIDAGSGGSSGSSGTSSSGGSGGGSSGGSSSGSSGWGGGYPSPTDPGLHCSPDGRSFSYSDTTPCPTPPPPPVGLCAGDYGDSTIGCARGGYGSTIPVGSTPPPGWPCTVSGTSDGGLAPTDAGAGG